MNKVVKAVHELVTQGKMPAKSVAIAIGQALLDPAQGNQSA